jgi:uncharacterized lipoprotein YehR (DUF1307 family)
MKLLTTLIAAIALVSLSACTDNAASKGYGGKQEIHLKPGRKFVNATWKESDLWYITRPMREDEKAESYSFKEKSNYGIMEGEVIFTESLK